jgi:hypothetical protein
MSRIPDAAGTVQSHPGAACHARSGQLCPRAHSGGAVDHHPGRFAAADLTEGPLYGFAHEAAGRLNGSRCYAVRDDVPSMLIATSFSSRRPEDDSIVDRLSDELRSRIDERRVTEVNVAVHVLNRMLKLGRSN